MSVYTRYSRREGVRGGKCGVTTIYSSRNNIDTRYRVVMYVAHLKHKI